MYRLHQDRRVALDCVFDGCSVLLLKDADVARVAQLLTTERRFAVKPSLLLIPMILATSAAIGDARADAHAQAAALLSPAQPFIALKADPQQVPTTTASVVLDAQD